MAGAAGAAAAGGTAVIGGFPTTGPAGGRLAIAGVAGAAAATIRGSCRGWGTIFLGAGVATGGRPPKVAAEETVCAGGAGRGDSGAAAGPDARGVCGRGSIGAAGCGREAGGAAAVTAAGEAETGRAAIGCGAAGALLTGGSTAAPSFLRWIAFSTSPGLDTCDQSIFCFGSGSGLAAPPAFLPTR